MGGEDPASSGSGAAEPTEEDPRDALARQVRAAALPRSMSRRPPVESQYPGASQVRAEARRRGWVPALCWEDEAVCDSCWSLEDAARHTAGAADETDPAVRPAALAAATGQEVA